MYWLLIIGFVDISGSLVHGMDDYYVKPPAAQDLSIDLYGEDNNSVVSSLSSSPASPPKTFPLTPAEPTGTSPLFPSTPNPEELKGLLSPATPVKEQQQLARLRIMRFSDVKANISPSSSMIEQEQQQLRTFKRRCCMIGGCLGVSALAIAFVLIHKYTHLF